MLSEWQHADFFLKVETSGKVAKSAGELSNIQRQDIKDARKGAGRYKLAEDESHSSEGGGGINQARKTNAHLQSRGLVQKII